MTSTAAARPTAAAVEKAARQVLEAGLGEGRSEFTPDAYIWTAEAADELDRCYVQRLETGEGTFLQKLEVQLADARPDAVQLAAELLYLNVLPLANVRGKAKRARINAVLSWLPEPIHIPQDLDAALEKGVFSGGVGFNTMLWSQLVHLVAFVQSWWQQSDEQRQQALADPWVWKAFVEQVGGGKAKSQRNALKYLAFPEHFQPIVNADHRAAIRQAFSGLLDRPTGDIDRDLLDIRNALQDRSPERAVDFYAQPWKEAWAPAASPPPTRHAWLVRPVAGGSGTVARWLREGLVSVSAHRLPLLPPEAGQEQVKEAVTAGYGSLDYVAQNELAEGVHRFLSEMQAQDLVAVLHGEALHLGELGPGPAQREQSGELWRPVAWSTLDEPVHAPDLAPVLVSRLSTPGVVVDVTLDLDQLVALTDQAAPVEDLAGEDAATAEAPPLRSATEELAQRLLVERAFLQEWIDLLSDRQQIIFFGPPGTGKTYLAERLARFLADEHGVASDRVALVQFHPSTSYEDFVEGYRPAAGTGSGTVHFELTPGPLTRLVSAAAQNPQRPYFLIIDEINRANLAKVFGELYYLLEYRDSGIQLLYRPGRPFSLPRNVFVLGTMNTADRSIALVDAAMRRRFAFVELHPDDEPVRGLLRRWLIDTKRAPVRAQLLDALNARIESRENKVGPSYLMKPEADREGGLERVWRYGILPLLVEQHYGRLTPAEVDAKYGLQALTKDLPTSGSVAPDSAVGGELSEMRAELTVDGQPRASAFVQRSPSGSGSSYRE